MSSLPAELYAEEIKTVIEQNATVIICGQTGCGKSTIIPQILMEEDFIPKDKCIAVTQPRRVAAASLAIRMAEMTETELGREVGYKFRFENVTNEYTRLIYMTDGMLLKEYAHDQSLKKYACIVLDEVHERSVASDILMWCLRQAQIERNETRRKLKLVLMSATMDLEPLKQYFSAQAYYIPGRLNKVELFYCKGLSLEHNDHIESAIQAVTQLHETEPLGHAFLVFLTGQDEIEATCRSLSQKLKNSRPTRIIPFYAQRRSEEVRQIFEVHMDSRKIIVATNIAETSITIPDVRVVIDSGKVKQKTYIHERRFSVLEVRPVSQAQAIQRAGRAGRCQDGKCYRLYSRTDYENLAPHTTPEIMRTSLSEVLFNLFSAKINSPKRCKLLNNPTEDDWCAALDELVALELIQAFKGPHVYSLEEYFKLKKPERFDLEFSLTEMGDKVKRLPLSPMLCRFVYVAWKLKCSLEALIIAAFCSVEDFVLPIESMEASVREEHERFMRTFQTGEGDHIRLIHIYHTFKGHNSKNVRAAWSCKTGFNPKRLEEVFEVRKQLRQICDSDENIYSEGSPYTEENKRQLKKAITESFYLNVCTYSMRTGCYSTLDGQEQIFMHPSSSINRQYPTTVVYTELIRTQKLYMRMVSPVERSAIEQKLKALGIVFKLFKRDGLENPQRRGSFMNTQTALKNF